MGEKRRSRQRGCALTSRVVRRAEQRSTSDQAHRNWPPSSEPLTLKQRDGCTANTDRPPLHLRRKGRRGDGAFGAESSRFDPQPNEP